MLFAFMFIVATSCEDGLDINTSPNNPGTSTTAFTLPTGQAGIAYAISLDLGIISGFETQYWTQAPQAGQYAAYDKYNYTGTATAAGWTNLYAFGLQDLNFVRTQALEDGTPNYAAIADFLTAYALQVATDMWGDVPAREALQGKNGNLTPVYDPSTDVYDYLIEIIDRGLSNVDTRLTAITPAADDLILGGDMKAWIRFANTLKLKIYLRQSSSRPSVAQSGIQGLYSSGASFVGGSENIGLAYAGTSGNENPYYSGDLSANSILRGVNVVASNSVLDRLNGVGDTRVDYFYNTPANGGGHVGLPQGEGTNQGSPLSGPIGNFSNPGTGPAGPASPVQFITGYESLFLQAEAVARGWGSGSAKALYDAGVQAAFDFAGAGSAANFLGTGDEYEFGQGNNTGVTTGTSQELQLADIHYQKWIAMNGSQNVEAWAEFRRTNIPADLPISIGGTGASIGSSRFPQRALYPTAEVSNNPNTPPVGNIGDPVFWSFEAN